MASVVAAGAKGIMLFQSDLTLEGSSAWKNGGKMMKIRLEWMNQKIWIRAKKLALTEICAKIYLRMPIIRDPKILPIK